MYCFFSPLYQKPVYKLSLSTFLSIILYSQACSCFLNKIVSFCYSFLSVCVCMSVCMCLGKKSAETLVFRFWCLVPFIFHSHIGTKCAGRIQYKILVDTLHIIDWVTHYYSIKASSTAIIIQHGTQVLNLNLAIYFTFYSAGEVWESNIKTAKEGLMTTLCMVHGLLQSLLAECHKNTFRSQN